ncbi:bifunctional diaminohydroxyphosphoribosylaminopyrimidine deaminase/5-amino-6-(5-phosphoribosylamino)uracil reductase RibD [Paenibacillus hamazuiensis]|uniref:bifunctional diaminohydroxyphosphoribosylaminopyrimidine deaminase/5-amino-6-(5-phosphoribosylamino)uracil reductase RibD n=1 Tax=Paenibacillus hamazuiensis TaxID=2936508 RepID=UPI00200C07CE|nr:bifunctional diaminohydroxyphosphoribosylaminopyrimidine deaminase/5-amino-6-(5-phosphoribosylamino)uracil reductase RibD [Paenibacillus hamazuiensis]
MELLNDEYYMRLALQLAAGPAGQTGINPNVGCVVVKDGRIVGMGAHLQRGTAHAEVHALNMAGDQAEGATAYVTLEPCSHHGRTPPCCDRLIREKVKRVVVACKDPNPLVAGEGIAKLRSHGIEVEVGLLEQEAVKLNEMFNKYIVSKLPFVTLKTASTLDGKIAAKTGDSKWITGEAARAYVHTLRHRHQAIMVGIGTVLHDDPQLTTRLTVPGLHPVRIVVDSLLRIPPEAKLVTDRTSETIVLATEQAPGDKARRLQELGVTVLISGSGPQVDLPQAMKRLGEREIGSILLEGGGTLNGAMLTQQLVDKLVLFFAPKLIGGYDAPGTFRFAGFERMSEALELDRVTVEQFGKDLCISGYPRYEREV